MLTPQVNSSATPFYQDPTNIASASGAVLSIAVMAFVYKKYSSKIKDYFKSDSNISSSTTDVVAIDQQLEDDRGEVHSRRVRTANNSNNGQSDIETPPISMSNVNMTLNNRGDHDVPPKKIEKAQASSLQGFGQPRDSRS